jgi:hypothetical protein
MLRLLLFLGLVLSAPALAENESAANQLANDPGAVMPPGTLFTLDPDSGPTGEQGLQITAVPPGAAKDPRFRQSLAKIKEASDSAQELWITPQSLNDNAQLLSQDASGPLYRFKKETSVHVGSSRSRSLPASAVQAPTAASMPAMASAAASTSVSCEAPQSLKKQSDGLNQLALRAQAFESPTAALNTGSHGGLRMPSGLDCDQQLNALKKSPAAAPVLSASQLQSIVRQGVGFPALQAAVKSMQEQTAKGWIKNPRTFVVTDYSLPSSQNRMHIIQLDENGGVSVHSVRTAHGKGSDPGNTGELKCFGSGNGGNQTPRGAFVTGGLYNGKHGESLRLHGLETANANACRRLVVIHPAAYMEWEGRVGRSWGCPALDPRVCKEVIGTIKGGTFIYNYGPQPNC